LCRVAGVTKASSGDVASASAPASTGAAAPSVAHHKVEKKDGDAGHKTGGRGKAPKGEGASAAPVKTRAPETRPVDSKPVAVAAVETKPEGKVGVSYKDAVKKAPAPVAISPSKGRSEDGVAGALLMPADLSSSLPMSAHELPQQSAGAEPTAVASVVASSPVGSDSVWAQLNKSLLSNGGVDSTSGLHNGMLGSSLGLTSTLPTFTSVSAAAAAAQSRKVVLSAAAAEFIPSYLQSAPSS
jgi:hypothetical protein